MINDIAQRDAHNRASLIRIAHLPIRLDRQPNEAWRAKYPTSTRSIAYTYGHYIPVQLPQTACFHRMSRSVKGSIVYFKANATPTMG